MINSNRINSKYSSKIKQSNVCIQKKLLSYVFGLKQQLDSIMILNLEFNTGIFSKGYLMNKIITNNYFETGVLIFFC